jgi:23S rRNA (cytosine1962-C5)-methyltransferase
VFDWLRANRTERYDLIVLDPPSFARNRAAIDGALRGYKEINLRAMRMLTPGGLLATYCCSQHVDRALYRSVLAAAAADAGRDLRLLRETGQPPDHPVRVTFPESEYLKGALLQAE